MESARIRRELTGSIRLLWTREQWLWSGALLVVAGFVLWVGATGAALNYGADFAGLELSVLEWSTTTTVTLGVVTVLWVLAPAAVVTHLVDRYVTNVSGNVHTHYRVHHPFLLVAPFLALFGVGVAVVVALGEVPTALAGALVAVGLLVLIRTIAYSYRVFSFAHPLVVEAFLFVSLALVAVTLLTSAGILAGRTAFVEAAARGTDDLLGTDGLVAVVTGTTTVGQVTRPTLLGLSALCPAGLATLYVVVQSLAGLVTRLHKPDVPRSQLRTGQRYPEFVRPVAEKSVGGTASGTAGSQSAVGTGPSQTSANTANASGGSAATASADSSAASSGTAAGASGARRGTTASADDSGSASDDDVSHTKVFTAPDDGDFEADVPGVDNISGTDDDSTAAGSGGQSATDETAVVGDAGGGYRCPTCTDTFDADTDFAYCPTCGTELEAE